MGFYKNFEEIRKLICTQKSGHMDLLVILNTWMFPCILQEASILFLLEFLCYYNNLYTLLQL